MTFSFASQKRSEIFWSKSGILAFKGFDYVYLPKFASGYDYDWFTIDADDVNEVVATARLHFTCFYCCCVILKVYFVPL